MFPLPSNRATRLGINILMLLAAGVALRLCQSVFVPTVIALLLACVLGPAAVWMHQRLKVRWVLACVTVIFGLIMLNILVTFVLFASVLAQVRNLDAREIAAGIEQVRKKAEGLTGMEFEEGPTAGVVRLRAELEPGGADLTRLLKTLVGRGATIVSCSRQEASLQEIFDMTVGEEGRTP